MAKSKAFRLPLLAILLALIAGVVGYYFYRNIFGPAVESWKEGRPFYVRTGWNTEEVVLALEKKKFIHDTKTLRWLMEQKNYKDGMVVPGKYILEDKMSLNELVNHLRAGYGEESVKLIFNNVRTLGELAGRVSASIEADSLSIIQRLKAPDFPAKYGFNQQTIIGMFLPDTYLVEWDTDADEFIDRMASEYKKFWTSDRQNRASALGLTQSEVTTLASIVQAEQQFYVSERPTIARLYLNRLKKGMRLQSDPTVIYAVGDFQINRVLTKHLSVVNPYNTYIYAGLPPGPINLPQKSSIDAVLNPDDNNYIYMCAKADFSGYHAFAKSLDEHNRNAYGFRKALNDRKIFQ